MKLEVRQRTPAQSAIGSPLLFVHGVCHGAWCWDNWADWFSERGRESTALSLRGHGLSAGRDKLDCFGLEDYRDDVLEIGSTMKLPILVGHSMGGAVAQLAVAAAPHMFKGLVLLASPPPDGLRLAEIFPLLLQVKGLLCLYKLGKGRKLSAREVQALPFFDGRISDEEARRFAECLQSESKRVGREASGFRAPRFQPQLPTLILGSARDRLLPISALRRTVSHYSGDLCVMDSSCHDLMLDPAWQEAAAKLENWLAFHDL